jgi:hypothetical protein
MAEANLNVLKKLWNTTEESTWESLLFNLDEIHEYDIITTDEWEDLHYAIKELAEDETPFPDSVGELALLLDRHM